MGNGSCGLCHSFVLTLFHGSTPVSTRVQVTAPGPPAPLTAWAGFWPFLNLLSQRCHQPCRGAQWCPQEGPYRQMAGTGHTWYGAAQALLTEALQPPASARAWTPCAALHGPREINWNRIHPDNGHSEARCRKSGLEYTEAHSSAAPSAPRTVCTRWGTH